MDDIQKLNELIQESQHIVVLTGAGISTASGIKDIRSKDGAANDKSLLEKYHYSYESIVSSTFFYAHPETFYKYYKEVMVHQEAQPNIAHLYLANLSKKKDVTIITQNIDGLHRLAHSNKVIEVHGTIYSYHCVKCHHQYKLSDILSQKGVPYCPLCGGIIKPDVVLFEEPLDELAMEASIEAMEKADLLIVIGSSLVVYPAAALPYYFRGKNIAIINREATPLDNRANIVIHDDIKSTFTILNSMIEK